MNKILFLLTVFLVLASASATATNCAVYFTGVGCPHCAKVDPILLPVTTEIYDLVVIEYEIYQNQQNVPVMQDYHSTYGTGSTIPTLVFAKNNVLNGDSTILEYLKEDFGSLENNPCLLLSGESRFESMPISELPGKPSLWGNNRILISKDGGNDNSVLVGLLTGNITEALQKISYKTVEPEDAQLSGGSVEFEHAVMIDGWLFEWNGDSVEQKNDTVSQDGNQSAGNVDLTLTKIVSLAAVDAINPCAFAVLALMLIAIMTNSPKDKRKILLSGLAFIASVFVIYIFYGLVMIKMFQLMQALTSVRLILYQILGVVAIVLGLLNIKDAIRYKPGGFATEMPIMFRPIVKKIISGVASPRGAFVAGALVTIFLLPCTIGPYVIASGALSFIGMVSSIPWLLLYNAVFVLPMIVIVLLIYFGIKEVGDVSGWKDKNIRRLHLAAGLIMFFLGLAMLLGWV